MSDSAARDEVDGALRPEVMLAFVEQATKIAGLTGDPGRRDAVAMEISSLLQDANAVNRFMGGRRAVPLAVRVIHAEGPGSGPA